jgi:CHAT domain-containing protein
MQQRVRSLKSTRTATGFHHRINVTRCAAAFLVFTAACGPRRPSSPEERYRHAVLIFQQGGLAQAVSEARAGAAESPPGSLSFHKFRLLEAEILIYQGNSQAAAAILSHDVPNALEFAGISARLKMLRSYLLGSKSPKEKSRLLDDAWLQASSLRDDGLLLDIELLQGIHVSSTGAEKARSLFTGVRQRASSLKDAYHESMALINLGRLNIQMSRYDEAIQWLEQSLPPARQVKARLWMVAALNNLAICHTQLGAFDEAVKRRREAIEWFGTGEVKAMRRNILGEIGSTYDLQGDLQNAVAYYREALALARELRGTDEIRRWSNNLAGALMGLGKWDEAERANAEALALAQTERAKAYATLNAALIAAGRRRYDEAVANYQAAIASAPKEPAVLWESHAGLGKAYSETGKDAFARRHFEQALRIIRDNRAGLSRDQYKITFLSRLIRFYQSYVEALMRNGASDDALEVAESSRARILAERTSPDNVPGRYDAAGFKRYAKRSGRVLLAYWLAPGESYLWVIAPQGSRCFPLPPADRIREWVDQYQAFIENLRNPLETENAPARRLYEALIAPAISLMPPGSQVVVLPDGALHRLNFETLPVYGEKPRYWIEDVTVSIAPSLGMLMSGSAANSKTSTSLLIFGNALRSVPGYEPLRHSAAEVEKIRQHYPPAEKVVLTGAQANPAAYREAGPERFAMIHFSAHAESNSQSPLDSAVILSPKGSSFKLYARDIMDTPVRADLVTISACRSAGARAYAGEGMVGLAWAFLRSGARYTIAGLWDVDDSSTPGMMDGLYGAMESGKSPIEALRMAKLAMIRSPGAWRKPYYWGAFQIYGR